MWYISYRGLSGGLLLFLSSLLGLEFLDGLADDLHEVLLEGFLFEDEAVLVPDEVGLLGVPAVLLHAALEEAEHVLVVGVLRELKLPAVVHELAELLGVALAELVHSHLQLLLLDVVILLVLGTAWEALPGEAASQEVEQYVPDCLEVVSPRLLVADVGVDRGVPCSAGQVLTLTEWDVLAVRVLVALGETEINDVDVVFICVVAADQEVVGLDVSVDDALLVHLLDALDLYSRANEHGRGSLTIWIAMQSTVLRSNFLRHSWNRSSRLLPRRSITITW